MSTWQPPGWATVPTRIVGLEVRKGDQVIKTHDCSKRKAYVLGRQVGAVDVHVPDEGVSRVHAALVHKGEAVYLIDLKSAAGVQVDGVRIKPNDATLLRPNAKIQLGMAPLLYVIRVLPKPAAPAAPSAGSPAAAVQSAPPVDAAPTGTTPAAAPAATSAGMPAPAARASMPAPAVPSVAALPGPSEPTAEAAAAAVKAAAAAAAATLTANAVGNSASSGDLEKAAAVAAATAASGGYVPPAWAVTPAIKVSVYLMEGGKKVQSLDLSRHPSYVLGRSAASAKLVVPHESVSRQHAALIHRGPPSAPTLHVVDLNSAKGTFVDLGSGWVRVPPNTPTHVPPGGRVRLGDCPTRIAFPPSLLEPPAESDGSVGAAASAAEAAPIGPAMPPPKPAPPPEDDTPRFSSLLSTTLLRDGEPEDAAAAAVNGDAGAGGEEEAVDEEAEVAAPKKNDDFRNALLPFLTAPIVPKRDERGGTKKKKRKNRADDSDSDEEPAPPVVLSKDVPASDNLILRKAKGPEVVKRKKSSVKIKF